MQNLTTVKMFWWLFLKYNPESFTLLILQIYANFKILINLQRSDSTSSPICSNSHRHQVTAPVTLPANRTWLSQNRKTHDTYGYLATVGNYLGSEMVAAVKFLPRDGGGGNFWQWQTGGPLVPLQQRDPERNVG